MTTYYGDPIHYGPFSLTTAWESAGVLFYNPRVILKKGDEVLEVVPWSQFGKIRDKAIALWLAEKRRSVSTESIGRTPAMNDERTIQDLAQEALDVQNACNLSGVVYGWGRSISRLRD